jgi:putative phosphoribosyl transferase
MKSENRLERNEKGLGQFVFLSGRDNADIMVSTKEGSMEEYWGGPIYADREEAGRVLAEKLESYSKDRPVVLAIPNGGVSVGLHVARRLRCPLHLIIVRKLQIPDNPEAGFGSVASDGSLFLNEALVLRLGLAEETIADQKEKALRSIRARMAQYGDFATFPNLKGRSVILIDDGLASGLSMEAAVMVVQRHEPAKVVVAVPTSSMSAFRRLSPLVDRVVCPDVSRLPIFAVADAYKVWRDLDDAEVIDLLEGCSSRSGEGK